MRKMIIIIEWSICTALCVSPMNPSECLISNQSMRKRKRKMFCSSKISTNKQKTKCTRENIENVNANWIKSVVYLNVLCTIVHDGLYCSEDLVHLVFFFCCLFRYDRLWETHKDVMPTFYFRVSFFSTNRHGNLNFNGKPSLYLKLFYWFHLPFP